MSGRALVGRDAELAAIDPRLAGGGLLTLVGSPGVGKTRLARAWGERRAAPACDLAGCRTAIDLAGAIGEALRVRLRSGGDVGEELARALAGRTGALVLDEAEHLDAQALRALGLALAGAPELAVLVTSRVRLGLAAEQVMVIGPLAFTAADGEALATVPSVALFLERARAVAGLAIVDDAVLHDVAAIARRLEGLPLAIELAASRTAGVGVARLRRDLESSLDALGEGAIDAPAHHRTLRAAIAASIARLDSGAHAILEAASVLPGGFSLEDLEAVAAGAGTDVTAPLRTLVDHSLIAARQREGLAVELRFGMHTVVRELACERVPAERRAELEARHARWRHAQVRALACDRSTRALDRIALDEAGLRAAWRWLIARGDGAAIPIACALGRLLDARGPLPDLVEILERTAALAGEHDGRAELECCRARARFEQADVEGAESAYRRALALADRREPTAEIVARTQLAMLAVRANDTDAAERHLEEAERRGRAIRDPWTGALLVGTRAQLHFRRGERTAARRALERCRVLSARAGDRVEEGATLGILGNLAHDEGRLDDAIAAYRSSVEMLASARAAAPEGIFRGYLATALHELGDADGARAAYGTALATLRASRSTRFEALFGSALGALEAGSGALDAAARELATAETLAEGESACAVVALHGGHLELARGDGGERVVARACLRLAAVDPALLRSSDDVRFAHRMLAAAARERLADVGEVTGAIVIGWEGAWARAPEAIDLAAKKVLRRILWEVALRRVAEPGLAIDASALVAAAWPGERMLESAAAHRLHVAISTLRRAGLGALERVGDGYRLEPAAEVRLSSRG